MEEPNYYNPSETCPNCGLPFEPEYKRWDEVIGEYICPDCYDEIGEEETMSFE